MSVVLSAPIVPFVLFGRQMEQYVEGWRAHPPSDLATGCLVVGLLAGDIFLPIPSSVVSTLAGWQLGAGLGTLASWLGMSLGVVLGFAAARRFGPGLARRFSSVATLERMSRASEKFGPVALVLTRAVPVLAEASVLVVGMNGLSWRRFLPPVLLANLGLSLAYAAFGQLAERFEWFPLALGVAVAMPLLLAGVVGRFLAE